MAVILCSFIACSKTDNDTVSVSDKTSDRNLSSNQTENADDKTQQQIDALLKNFFDCFEKADFENMKQYCTESFVENFYQKDTVFGNRKAKLSKVSSIKYNNNADKYIAETILLCDPVGVDKDNNEYIETAYDIIIVKDSSGKFLVDEITTDSTILD